VAVQLQACAPMPMRAGKQVSPQSALARPQTPVRQQSQVQVQVRTPLLVRGQAPPQVLHWQGQPPPPGPNHPAPTVRPRARNRPISPQPEGQCPFRVVCGVAALAHSGAMGCAPRLASHPEKSAARHQIIYGQVLKLMAFFKFRWPGQKGQEVKAKPVRSSRAAPAESIETMRRRARHRLIGAVWP